MRDDKKIDRCSRIKVRCRVHRNGNLSLLIETQYAVGAEGSPPDACFQIEMVLKKFVPIIDSTDGAPGRECPQLRGPGADRHVLNVCLDEKTAKRKIPRHRNPLVIR